MSYSANMTRRSRHSDSRNLRAKFGSRLTKAVVMLCALSAMAGCAAAQSGPDNPLAPAAKLLKQRTDTPPAADFVQQSRPDPASLGYIPTGSARAEPSGKPMSRDAIKAEEARLEALLEKHERASGRKPSAKPGRSAAGDPYVAPVKKAPAKCVLTCEIK